MKDPYAIQYEKGLQTLPDRTLEAVLPIVQEDLPYAWRDRYDGMCDGPTNVLVVAAGGLQYLFDFCTELGVDREDRVVAAYGVSRPATAKRSGSRIRGFPGSDERGDRGHFLAHAAGGGADINLFHQAAALNRGWSFAGRRYRAMERHCATHAGTFFFSRPVYADATARPSEIEFGLLMPDATFWVEVFANEE